MASRMDVEILDRCLRRIQTHESSLEECLRELPDLAEELRPLLIAAGMAQRRLAPAGPTVAFRTSAWKRLAKSSRTSVASRQARSHRRRGIGCRPAYSLASLLLALGLLAGSVGVAYASGEALPGDTLYGVKRGLERAALALSASNAGDTELLLRFADRRLGEAEELLRRGRPADVAAAAAGYDAVIAELLELAAQEPAQLDAVAEALGRHALKLQSVLDQAPEQAKPGLTRALESSQRGIEAVEKVRGEQPEGEIPPGQLKKTPGAEDSADSVSPGKPKKTPKPED